MSFAVLAAALFAGLVDLSVGNIRSTIPLLAGMLVTLGTLWINKRGHTAFASVLLVGTILSVITLLLLTGQGIHDISITLYPLLMILISLLFDRRGSIIGYLLIVVSVALVVFSEVLGLIFPAPEGFNAQPTDFIVVSVILVVAGISLSLVHRFLNASLEQARLNALALQASEARFRSLAENAPNLIININRQGMVLYSNRVSLAPDEDLDGHCIFDYFPPAEQAAARQLVEQVFQTGEQAAYEGQILFSPAALSWYSFRLSPIRQDGVITSLVLIATSIQKRIEIEEALKYRTDQLTILNRIAVAISSLRDLNGVLDEILAQLQSAMLLDAFYVALLDESGSQSSFPIMYDNGQRYAGDPLPVTPGGWIDQVVKTRQPFLLNRSEAELQGTGYQHMLGNENRISASVMVVPLMIGERTIGVVSAQSYTLNAYGQEQVDFLQSAASQIAVAVDNARLYEGLARRKEQLATLNRIGTVISGLQELDQLLNLVLEQIQVSLGLDAFYVVLHHPEDDTISYPLTYDSGKLWQEPRNAYRKETRLARVLTQGESFLINRTADDVAALTAKKDGLLGDTDKVSASILMVPLQIGQRIIGLVSAQSYTLNAYSEEHLEFLRGAANQIAIAIENSRLYEALQSELAERERSEAALRQSEARLRAIIENFPYDLWLCDMEGRYILQSSLSLRIAGNILGKRVAELNAPEDNIRTWIGLHQRVLAGETVMDEGQWPVDGEMRHFVTMLAPAADHGEMMGFVGLNIDITDVKRSQEKLRRYAARIETLHELDQVILAVRSSQEIAEAALNCLPRLLPCSSASVALVDAAASTLQVVATYMDGETRPGSSAVVAFSDPDNLAQLVQGQPVHLTNLVTQPLIGSASLNKVLLQGLIRTAIVVPLLHQNKLVGVLSVGAERSGQLSQDDVMVAQEVATQLAIAIYQAQLNMDIQELNADLEQRVLERTVELRAAVEELEAFSFSVSHDLRAPLRAMIGYLQLFSEDYGSSLNAEAQDFIRRIQSNAQSMNQLIDEMLSLARVGRHTLQRTTFNLADVYQEVLAEALAGKDSQRLQITLHSLPAVEADRGLLRQVCQNLVDNAIKYSRNRPVSQVEIGSLVEAGSQVFYVRDNGAGFDMKYAGRLFHAFERLHRQDEYEGTGVGLAIVKRIVQRHGGRVWVQAAPDQGATFYFTLGS